MLDPHVDSLQFRLEPEEGYSFSRAPPLDVEFPGFRCRLADNVLVCYPLEHFAAEPEAREAIQPFLRTWELDVALKEGRLEFRFRFEGSRIVDRGSAPPDGRATVVHSFHDTITAHSRASLHKARGRYPEASVDFVASPNVETLWSRFEGAMAGKEQLLAMAYFCLSFLEDQAAGRTSAAAQFRVHPDVLRKLGELSSTRGDSTTARKASAQQPLTPRERVWVIAALRVLIRRVGQIEAGSRPGEITMADVPAV